MASMTARYVALLRGINVGTAKRVAMADLRKLFEGLGFRDVRTLLNSGNVVFSVPDNRSANALGRIEKALAQKLGLVLPVSLLSGAEVAAAVRDNPLADVADNPSRFLVVVPRDPSDLKRLQALLKERWHPEALALGKRVAYLWCADGVLDSPLWTAVERALDRSATARNLATMTKLVALATAGQS
jgi:uncharacterized protein (DUF1697 family)